MRTLLGVLMVLVVSGGEDVTFYSILDSSVLLQCPCPNRDLQDEFMWQMEKPKNTLVFSTNSTPSGFSDTYKGRAKVFHAQDTYNCSLLLTNITADDKGTYRCSFFNNGIYNRSFVNLEVYANYSVCQKNSATKLNDTLSAKVFQCDAKGCYREAEIQWYLDSQLLKNSSTTTIMHTHNLSAVTGLYSFSSKLIIELRGTSEPICDVKAKSILTISSRTCRPETQIRNPEQKYLKRYFKFIPIALVLGFSLVLCYRWKHSQGLPWIRKKKHDYSKC